MTFDRRLQRYLRRSAARGRETVPARPFTAFFNGRDPLRYLNYAIPDEGATFAPADAEALAEAFAARGRLPRLEYVESEAPALAAVLEAAGYELEARLDLMTCTPATLRRPSRVDGLELVAVEPGADREIVRALLTAQHGAFEQLGAAPTEADVDRFSSTGVVAMAAGEPAAGGVFTVPEDGLSELAGIGTLPRFRRRGIAAALTAALTEAAFARGVEIAFLTPGDADTRRVYEHAGFAATSVVLVYARE